LWAGAVTLRDGVIDAAIAVGAVNGIVGAYGALRWYRVETSRAFWIGLRGAQVLAFAFALAAGILWLAHRRAGQGLFYLYALLPLAVGFIAEQLRVVAADHVLAARGLESARDVGELPEADQRRIVVAILRREMGVMAAAALVVCFLALRAAGTW
jgi:hypothetical protein